MVDSFRKNKAATKNAEGTTEAAEAAASVIQRTFRLQLLVYRQFGADLFCMRDGSRVCYGEMSFVSSLLATPSRFITVADTSSPAYLSHFLTRRWRLHPPEVLISVIGGAQDFKLAPSLQSVFSEGLSSAASSSRAWILSGGTNTGVMKLVGAAMQDHPGDVPVIGIGPWGAITGREQLAECHGEKINYESFAASSEGASLNPGHTHFILVDSGKSGAAAWGSEIEARFNFEDYLAGIKQASAMEGSGEGVTGQYSSIDTFLASNGLMFSISFTGLRHRISSLL